MASVLGICTFLSRGVTSLFDKVSNALREVGSSESEAEAGVLTRPIVLEFASSQKEFRGMGKLGLGRGKVLKRYY